LGVSWRRVKPHADRALETREPCPLRFLPGSPHVPGVPCGSAAAPSAVNSDAHAAYRGLTGFCQIRIRS
jgi:hypothetical protein